MALEIRATEGGAGDRDTEESARLAGNAHQQPHAPVEPAVRPDGRDLAGEILEVDDDDVQGQQVLRRQPRVAGVRRHHDGGFGRRRSAHAGALTRAPAIRSAASVLPDANVVDLECRGCLRRSSVEVVDREIQDHGHRRRRDA